MIVSVRVQPNERVLGVAAGIWTRAQWRCAKRVHQRERERERERERDREL